MITLWPVFVIVRSQAEIQRRHAHEYVDLRRQDQSQKNQMKEAVIVSAVRTAVGKAPKGTLKNTRPDDLGAAVIREAVAHVSNLQKGLIEDVIMGCAFPEAEQGMNVARTTMIAAGLPVETSAMTVNRYCSSGLQTIALAADRIATGGADVIVAGGLETMSMIPMGGNKIRPNPALVETYPDYYLNMGLTAENLAKKYEVTREQADEFSLRSHQKAADAIRAGKFKDEIIPYAVQLDERDENGRVRRKEAVFDTDEGVRYDASMEGLAKLKPAFHAKGTVTAGNSSQMSDGAAAVVVMSMDRANELGVKPLARFVSFATAGCLPEEMGIGPVYAIPKALKMAGLTLDQIDVIELNEAFAVQGLAVMKVLEMNPAKVNVNGGAIALGHPLGCTGAKLTATILQELIRREARYGMVTMCVGGGMGAAGIFERID
jgi:acetyl-CoA acyltransferase